MMKANKFFVTVYVSFSSDIFLCSWQAASSKPYPYSLLWWWPTRPMNISTCDIRYIDEKNKKQKTVLNVSANTTVHLPASEAWAECKDDLHRIHRSQRVKLRIGEFIFCFIPKWLLVAIFPEWGQMAILNLCVHI